MNNSPIGIFDSGFGGLSVWRAVRQLLPDESIVYLGDGARCPYGTKSVEEVCRYAEQAVERLLERGCKLIVVACNTATVMTIGQLRARYPHLQFVGLEPAVKPAALSSRSGVIGVLATRNALEGEMFRNTASRYADKVKILTAVGEGFVEIVERGEEHTAQSVARVREVVEPLIQAGADRIVLGCTHYPFLRKQIEAVIADRDVEVVCSSVPVARRVAELLDRYDLRAAESNVAQYDFITFADDAYAARLRAKAMEE